MTTTPATSTTKTMLNFVLATMFLLVVFLPLLDVSFGLDPTPPMEEKRKPAEQPTWSWSDSLGSRFTREFESYYNDAFGFRNALLRLNSLIKVCVLGVTSSDTAIVGRDGWFYLGGNAQDLHLGHKPFDDEDLDEWQAVLETWRDWLADRGCRFLLVFVPEKQSIYPEHLPAADASSGDRTRTDQLVDHLREHSDVPILDLREALLAGKAEGQIYSSTDTHWNLSGVQIAYRAIMTRLAQWFPSIELLAEGFPPRRLIKRKGGDLAQMLGVEQVVVEDHMAWEFPGMPPYRRAELEVPAAALDTIVRRHTFATESTKDGLPSAVVFRDSFTTLLQPLLSHHFQRVAYLGINDGSVQVPFVPELIEAENPDVVVIITVERKLMGRVPELSSAFLEARHLKNFLTDGRTRLLLSPETGFEGVVTHHVHAAETEDGLRLDCDTNDPQVLLPALTTTANERVVVRAEIEVPEATLLYLFFGTADDPTHNPDRALRERLLPGRNHVFLELPAVPVVGRLRLDPGVGPGSYLLREVEVRTMPAE